MKKQHFILLLLSSLLTFSACQLSGVEDRYGDYPNYKPVYMSLEILRSSIKSTDAQPMLEPGKIYYKSNKIFINEKYKGVHVLDNSDPANTEKIGFIEIPGNIDISIKGNILYADSAIDLVAIDIANFPEIKEVKRVQNMFPEPSAPDGNNNYKDKDGETIVNWEEL